MTTVVNMTTVVTITTVEGEQKNVSQIVVGDTAQKHVLRSFNPALEKSNGIGHIVDDTKVLCAALIQQMINIKTQAADYGHTDDGDLYAQAIAQMRAAERAIELVELVQMQLVKANFVQA